jgi:hypothetical protein
MSVTCRREARGKFEALGFVLESDPLPECPVIEMVDEQANYAHSGKMPTDIPYYGTNGSGSNYGAGDCACDGKEYAEVETGHGSGFMVSWDYKKSRPTPASLTNIRRFIRVHQRAQNLLKKLRAKTPHTHVFSPHTQLCNFCGISAKDDAVENQPCPR